MENTKIQYITYETKPDFLNFLKILNLILRL